MKIAEHEKAVEMRKGGFTYPEISKQLGVSKGTLSRWLKDVSCRLPSESRERQNLARARNAQVLHKRKLERVKKIKEEARNEIDLSSPDVLKLLGLMSYWCEGSKTKDSLVKFTNSDPELIKLIIKWLKESCDVPSDKIRVHLRVHDDVDRVRAKKHWSGITGISLNNFYKTTCKTSESGGKRANKLPNGIASIIVCDTNLFYRIQGWMEALSEQLNGV